MYLINNAQWNQKLRKAMPGGKYIQLLLPSIIGIVLSLSFFIGASWAWYTDAALGVLENVSMADFSCDVSVISADTDFSDTRRSVSGEPAEFSLVANSTYEVKISISGTATTGYCILKFWDAVNERQMVYYTDQITADSAFVFTYQNGVTERMTVAGDLQADIFSIETHWGDWQIAALEGKQEEIQYVHAGDVIGNAPIQLPSEAEYDLQNVTQQSSILDSDGLQVIFTADEGFTLPTHVTVTINNGEALIYELVNGVLTVHASLIPNGSRIVVSGSGEPVQEIPDEPVSDFESESMPEKSDSETESQSDETIPEPTSEETVPETESESVSEEDSLQMSETDASPAPAGEP